MLSVENRELEGGGPELKAKIWDTAALIPSENGLAKT